MVSLLAFVVTILVIVSFHEYGHFLAMRFFGVRVVKFSVGFGPALWHRRSRKSGTDYVIAAFPLGGFVKPYDSRADKQQTVEAEISGDFATKPAWQKLIVYAAGPFANFLLALVLYWIIAVHGQYRVTPVVGDVVVASAAAKADIRADDTIVAIDGKTVHGWQQLTNLLMAHIGSDQLVEVALERNHSVVHSALSLADWNQKLDLPPLQVLGITPKPPAALLGKVTADGAAQRAGLQAGDLVTSVDGEPVTGWKQWVALVQAHPGETLEVGIERNGMKLVLPMVPTAVEANGEMVGVVGVQLGGLTRIQYSPLEAVVPAWSQLKQQTGMLIGATWRLFSGKLGLDALGGPITIAKVAGDTASVSIVTFFAFLAFFSISLGILNLLPVPMLDGGWMVFCFAEMIIRRPLPEKFLVAAQSVGLTLVVMLMVVAFYNDLIRQFG